MWNSIKKVIVVPMLYHKHKKTLQLFKKQGLIILDSGPDGTRTRDLRRDRAAF